MPGNSALVEKVGNRLSKRNAANGISTIAALGWGANKEEIVKRADSIALA
jgi:hypothetical protein